MNNDQLPKVGRVSVVLEQERQTMHAPIAWLTYCATTLGCSSMLETGPHVGTVALPPVMNRLKRSSSATRQRMVGLTPRSAFKPKINGRHVP